MAISGILISPQNSLSWVNRLIGLLNIPPLKYGTKLMSYFHNDIPTIKYFLRFLSSVVYHMTYTVPVWLHNSTLPNVCSGLGFGYSVLLVDLVKRL